MSLDDWLANHWIEPHEASPEEVRDLLKLVDRDLGDAAIDRLSADWRLGIAYNAALQLATLALAASGYRPTRIRGHERAIQSLRHTVGLDRNLVDTLDAVRRKRNLSNYERAGTASPSEADDVYQLAKELRIRIVTWLEEHYPELRTASQED